MLPRVYCALTLLRNGLVVPPHDRINTILDRLFAVVPAATVLLSTISDVNMTKCATYPQGACPETMPEEIIEVNTALPSKVAAVHTAAGRKVFVHDVNADAQWVEKDYWTWGTACDYTPSHLPPSVFAVIKTTQQQNKTLK